MTRQYPRDVTSSTPLQIQEPEDCCEVKNVLAAYDKLIQTRENGVPIPNIMLIPVTRGRL